MQAWFHEILQWLALPQFGLSTLFVVALVSATLLPMGSEPAVVGLLQLNPHLFWAAIFTATAGNTIGGAISWWMGLGAHKAWHAARPPAQQAAMARPHPVVGQCMAGEAACVHLLSALQVAGSQCRR